MAHDQSTSLPTVIILVLMRRQDDASALDLPTMHRWNMILRVFTLEYLGLSPPLAGARKRDVEEGSGGHRELVSDCLRVVS